ncbi:chitin synthase III catalytic subunit [Lipomyces japonicus]|uniref:chitin synthase III catalytic subunit n=1 Tax=Lipomyces japonicus TaxID=56871 RepID=UPI0034CFFD67
MVFGKFDTVCRRIPVAMCSLLGPYSTSDATGVDPSGIAPVCYARSIDLANTVIFQTGTAFINIGALIMSAIMIFNVRQKYTAVGRKEILSFFYLYVILTMISLCVDCGVVPPASSPYPYFVAAQNGLTTATCWCLLINGFVGFQIYEDGTKLSLWILRIFSFAGFCLAFVVSILTFQSWGGLSPTNTVGLFVVMYIVNAVALVIYIVLQVLLVLNTLEDRWPLGDIALAVFFFVVGQILLYVFSNQLCERMKHYLDGLFFATVCNLFSVMMIYKYYDSITKEDLEFSVGAKPSPPVGSSWQAKEYYDDDSRRPYGNDGSEYTGSFYNVNRHSGTFHY